MEKLPSISDIYNNDAMPILAKDAAFQVLVNQEPKADWLKEHPTVKNEIKDKNGNKKYVPAKYLPIERVEWLLTNIFMKWRVEIHDSKLIANSIVVTIRLYYYDHSSHEWHWQDGIGAAPLQTNSGAGATAFDQIKNAAVQMAAPMAETYAVKDAAEKIGKLFGKDLNRKEIMNYEPLADRYKKAME